MAGKVAGSSGRTLSSTSKKKIRKKSVLAKPEPDQSDDEPPTSGHPGSGLDELTLVANYLQENGMADIRGIITSLNLAPWHCCSVQVTTYVQMCALRSLLRLLIISFLLTWVFSPSLILVYSGVRKRMKFLWHYGWFWQQESFYFRLNLGFSIWVLPIESSELLKTALRNVSNCLQVSSFASSFFSFPFFVVRGCH